MLKRRVLFLPGHFNHLTYQGIIEYAHKAGWVMNLRYIFSRTFPVDWQGDGVISYHNGAADIHGHISKTSVPVVDLGHLSPELNLPRVWKDDVAIGSMAATYYLSRGFKHFAFFKYLWKPKGIPSNHLRFTSFKDSVARSDHTFHDLGSDLVKALQEAPKPLAILAGNDDHALKVLDACNIAGLRVPEEVSILGIDNNPDFCGLATTPLSSIDSGCHQVGYEAARLLDQLMDGQQPPEETILVPPCEVVTRQSTDILAVPHLPTARALRVLLNDYHDANLNLDEVARQVSLSRRNLEAAFKRHLGHTMFDYLERLRTDEALALLEQSDYRGYEIAEMCGFSNTDHLTRTIKKRYGTTIRCIRQRVRSGDRVQHKSSSSRP